MARGAVAGRAEEIRRSFEENGFVVVRGVFSGAEMRRLLEVVGGIEARVLPYREQDLLWEPSNPRLLRNAFGVMHQAGEFRAVALDPRLVDAVEALIGPDIDIYGDGLFAKPAREGSVVPPHQDMPYWSFRPYRLVTAWLALEPATPANGCLRFFAGSHKLGVLEHAPSNVPGNSKSLARPDSLDPATERAVELEPGDVCFHHCLTVHRSDPNRSDRSRRGYTVIYMPGETEYTGAEPYRFPFVHVRGCESPAFRSMAAGAEPEGGPRAR